MFTTQSKSDLIYGLTQILYMSRAWHRREQNASNSRMHAAIVTAIRASWPDNWHLLVLEWPHHADSDPSRIAYTRDERAGEADKQTVTSVGKYLRRHFSALSDHEIRDIAARFSGHSYELVWTMPEMLDVLSRAPKSCMNNHTWGDFASAHPYNVYDPKYGWGMAVSKQGDRITGRCLVNRGGDTPIFVRSYNDSETFSHTNEGLEAWLRENGYKKARSWAGLYLAYVEHPRRGRDGAPLAPYLDGDDKYVNETTDKDGNRCLYITDNPDYESHACDRTDGAWEDADTCYCDHCESSCDEDDLHGVGYHGDTRVCDSCLEYNYIYAIGRGGDQYYVHSDDVVYVESQSEHFHTDYLSRNGIVELASGDYEHTDNAVYVNSRNEWYHIDDEDIVHCAGSGEYELLEDCVELADGMYCLRDDAWQCSVSGNWYSDDDMDEQVEMPNGDIVHSDYAPDEEELNEMKERM